MSVSLNAGIPAAGHGHAPRSEDRKDQSVARAPREGHLDFGEIVRGTAREIVHLQKFEQLRKRFPVLVAEFPFLYAESQLGQRNRRL